MDTIVRTQDFFVMRLLSSLIPQCCYLLPQILLSLTLMLPGVVAGCLRGHLISSCSSIKTVILCNHSNGSEGQSCAIPYSWPSIKQIKWKV